MSWIQRPHTRITPRRDGSRNGNIGTMNESITLSFAVVFQAECLPGERVFRQESGEDHSGNHPSMSGVVQLCASAYQGYDLRGEAQKKVYEPLSVYSIFSRNAISCIQFTS